MKCAECEKDVQPCQVGYYRLHQNDCVCSACLERMRSQFQSGSPVEEAQKTPKH